MRDRRKTIELDKETMAMIRQIAKHISQADDMQRIVKERDKRKCERLKMMAGTQSGQDCEGR